MAAQMDQDNSLLQCVENAKAGDRTAFEQLVRRYEAGLAAGIERQLPAPLRTRTETEEVLQETLCRAFQSIERFEWRGEKSVYLWLHGIARNVIREQAKKRKCEDLPEPEQVQARDVVSPSTELRRGERFDRLEESLSRLKPEYEQVLRLARMEGLKTRDIAERMNRSENSVKHLMARAIRQLRELFGETESLHLPDRVLDDWGAENERR